jgi:hypothetical protein
VTRPVSPSILCQKRLHWLTGSLMLNNNRKADIKKRTEGRLFTNSTANDGVQRLMGTDSVDCHPEAAAGPITGDRKGKRAEQSIQKRTSNSTWHWLSAIFWRSCIDRKMALTGIISIVGFLFATFYTIFVILKPDSIPVSRRWIILECSQEFHCDRTLLSGSSLAWKRWRLIKEWNIGLFLEGFSVIWNPEGNDLGIPGIHQTSFI